jgi:3-hydroxyisobutyrate dehydrogenase-like beta-hydroxyacid dehydrogenase
VVIESLGEAMALVGKGGVGRHQYLDILTSTLFNAPIYKTYGALIADRKFLPAGLQHPLARRTSVSPSRRPKSCACHCRSPASCVTAS